jgi:HEAT repeats
MRSIFRLATLAALVFLSAVAFAQQSLSITMRLSSTTVLLGEPVWVDVAVTNQSAHALRVGMGADCFGVRPIKIVIPEAEPALPQNVYRCYRGIAGSCASSGPSLLEPGDTLKRRYVLAGDFRIAHPGHYRIMLEKQISYAGALPGENPAGLMRNAVSQSANDEAFLDVQAADPARLLKLEQTLAAEYARPLTLNLQPTVAKVSATSPDAARRVKVSLDEQRMEALDVHNALGAGLAEYPAAGMESEYNGWIIRQWNYGLLALANLNTPEARRLVAQAADPSENLYRRWREYIHVADGLPVEKLTREALDNRRAAAIYTLARMGDSSYVPLLEKLAGDSSVEVRQQAISNLGLLGGETELPKLTEIARNAPNEMDRQEAITAMGDTHSLKAVPLLIELLALPDAGQPAASNDALMTLTHHQVQLTQQLSAEQLQGKWQQWWNENKGQASVYGPFDCAGNTGKPGSMDSGTR